MQLCQQHRERRSRQAESGGSFPTSPATAATAATGQRAGGTGESLSAAAAVSSSTCFAGNCNCLSTCGSARGGACSGGGCGGWCRAPPTNAGGAACKAEAACQKSYNSHGRSSTALSNGQVLQLFPSSDLMRNSAGSGNSSNGAGLIGRDETVTDTATSGWQRAATAGERGGRFLLGTPRHQQRWQQPLQLVQQQSGGPQQASHPQHETDGIVFSTGAPGNGCRVAETAAASVFRQQDERSPPFCSNKSPARGAHCTCSSTCTNPCSRNSCSAAGGNAVIPSSTSCSTDPGNSRNTAYNVVPSTTGPLSWTTTCNSKVRTTSAVGCSSAYAPSFCSRSRAFPTSSTIVAACGDGEATGDGVEVVPRHSCSSSCRGQYYKKSSAAEADDQNELEYYVYSAADDIVGRYCESGYIWEAAVAAIFEISQQEVDVHVAPQKALAVSATAEQQPDAAVEGQCRKSAEASGSGARAAPAGRKAEQPAAAAGGATCDKASPASAPLGKAATGATAGTATRGRKGRKKETSAASVPQRQTEETLSEGGCFVEQQGTRFSRQEQQAGICNSSSRSNYDNELEMYEHHSVDIWIHKTTCRASHTAQVAATAVPAAEPTAAAFQVSSYTGTYGEDRQQESYGEEMSNPGARTAVDLLSCRSLSNFSSRPPLAVTGGEEGAGTAGKPANRTSSSSVCELHLGGTQAAGKSSASGSSSSKASSSSDSFAGTATTAEKGDAILRPSSAAATGSDNVCDTAEPAAAVASLEYVPKLSSEYDNEHASREVPLSSAADVAPAEETGKTLCYNFFSCMSPDKAKLNPSGSFRQEWCFKPPSEPAGASAAADASCSAAAGTTAEADSAALEENKSVRPEAAAPAPPPATALPSTAAAAATSAAAAMTHNPLTAAAAATSLTVAAGTGNGGAQGFDRLADNEYDNELDIYVYRTNQCLIQAASIQLLQRKKGDAAAAAECQEMYWASTDHQRVASGVAAVPTRYKASGRSPVSCSACCIRTQHAGAAVQQQDCTAAATHGCSAAAGQGMPGPSAGGKESEKTNCSSCCCCCSSSPPSSSIVAMQCDRGPHEYRCDGPAAKHWLLQQKASGACQTCNGYAQAAAAGSRNRCNKLFFFEQRPPANSGVASPRTLCERIEDSPFAPVLLYERDAAASEDGEYLDEDLRWQHQVDGKPPRPAYVPQVDESATRTCFGHQQELQKGQQQQPRSSAEQQRRTWQQTQWRSTEQRVQHQPQPPTLASLPRQDQGQRGRQQQKQQQPPTRPAARGGSAACRRQQLEDILLTGRQDWHVSAYGDVVELKKKRQDVRKSRSLSCSSRAGRTSAGGSAAAAASLSEGRKPTRKAVGSDPPKQPVGFDEVRDAASSPSCGAADGRWPLRLSHHSIGSNVCSTACQQQQCQWLEQEGGVQQQHIHWKEVQGTVLQQQHQYTQQELQDAQETEQQFSMSSLQQRRTRVASQEQYSTVKQQQQKTQLQLQETHLQQRLQEPDEREYYGTNGCMAHYPMHARHHLKPRNHGDDDSTRGTSRFPPSDPAFRSSWKRGEEEDNTGGLMKPSVRRQPANSCRTAQQGHWKECSSREKKASKNLSGSIQVDSCCLREESNRNSAAAYSYMTVADNSGYVKSAAPGNSPSSLVLSPASPSEQEEQRPTYGQHPDTFVARYALQHKKEVVEEEHFDAFDTHSNTTYLTQGLDCCGQQQQQQQQGRHQQQQHPRERHPQQQHHHREHQQQPREQAEHERQQTQQCPLEHDPEQHRQHQQRQCKEVYETEALPIKQLKREHDNEGAGKQKPSRVLTETLNCTCRLSPRPRPRGDADAVGRCREDKSVSADFAKHELTIVNT